MIEAGDAVIMTARTTMNRAARLLVLGVVLTVGCGSAPPQTPLTKDFDPVLVVPTIAPGDIADDSDVFVSTSDHAIMRWVDERVGGDLGHETRSALAHHHAEPNLQSLSRIGAGGESHVVFVLRRTVDTRVCILMKSGDLLVPSVSWVALALRVTGADPEELRAWQREMARRIATSWRATGIVLFPNGNALAVILDEELDEHAAEDSQLVAKTRFLRAGTFSVDAWGPKLNVGNDARVVISKMNNHDGFSVSDMMLRASRPAPTP